MRGLVVLLAIGVFAYLAMQYRTLAPDEQAKWRRLGLLYGGMGLLVLLAMTNRIAPLMALFSAATPWVHRAITAKNMMDRFRARGAGTSEEIPRVTTRFIRMEVDPETGAIFGVVREGPFEGQSLVDLSREELLALFEHCRQHDAQSTQLLKAWMDRELGKSWHREAGVEDQSQSNVTTSSATLSPTEAYAVLGLSAGCSKDDVVAAHRKLIQRVHPDRGGADWLAAKVNEAKRVALNSLE